MIAPNRGRHVHLPQDTDRRRGATFGQPRDVVEFETMTYVDWFNHRRLHGELTDDNSHIAPAEDAYYRQITPATEPITQ